MTSDSVYSVHVHVCAFGIKKADISIVEAVLAPVLDLNCGLSCVD